MRRALRDARLAPSTAIIGGLSSVASAANSGNEALAIRRVRSLNLAARRTGARFVLLPVDLEYCALVNASTRTVRRIARRLGIQVRDRDALLRALGSKAGQGPVASPQKAPWTRAVIAQELPMREISQDVRDLMSRWLRMTLGDARRANDVLRAAGLLPRS
jgi:hypothetical protein